MKRGVLSLLILLASWLVPQPPAMAADPLTHIPAEAFVVVRFDSLDQVQGNFKDMLDAIGPAAAPAADGLVEGISEMLEFRGAARSRLADAIDGKAPIHLALFPMFDARQAPTAIFVKAKDEAKLRRAVLRVDLDDEDTKIEATKRDDGFEEISREGYDRKFYFGKRDELVVYTSFEEIVKKLTEKGGKTFADAVEARGTKLLRGDMAVAVNVAPVVEKHKAEIEAAREEINEAIKSLPDEMLGTGSPETVKKMYMEAVRYAFNAVYDTAWFAGNASFSPQGARAEGLVGVKKSSDTDRVLAANPPAALENLDALPAGSAGYYGLNISPKLMTDFMVEALKMSYGSEIRDKDAADKAVAAITEAKLGPTASGVSFASDGKPGMRSTTLTQAAAPRRFNEAVGLLAKALGESDNPLFTMTMTHKAAAEKYKDYTIDLVTMKFKIKDAESEIGKLMDAMFRGLFGGEGLEERLTTLDKLSVQVMGNDPKLLERTLDNIADSKDVTGLDKAFGKTRDALGKEANAVFMLNVPQIVLEFVTVLKDVPFIGDGLKMAPFNFSLKPASSFAGFSLSTEAQGLRLKGFIPVEQPKAMLQIFAPGL